MVNPKIYLAGPIDLGKDVPNWRHLFSLILEQYDINAVSFDPSAPYKCSLWGKPNLSRSKYIEGVNTRALELADIFVMCLPHGTQSVGTPIEMDMAAKMGKTIMIITDIPIGKSVYLDNRAMNPKHWFNVDNFSDLDGFKEVLHNVAISVAQL